MSNTKNPLSRIAPLAVPILAGALIFTAGPGLRGLRADDDCQHRIAKADHKLHEAIEHHGPRSEQAEHWRHELHEAREECWRTNHRWWDEDEHRWRTEHDWNDRDHDRD